MSHTVAVHPGAVLVDELEEREIAQAALASPTFWLNLQNNCELSQVNRKTIRRIKPIAA